MLLLHDFLAPRICLCTCCTACHIGPGCKLPLPPFPRWGLRLGVRGRCAPPVLELAPSEGRPRSPQGQFKRRGAAGDDVAGTSSVSLSRSLVSVAACGLESSSASSASAPRSTSSWIGSSAAVLSYRFVSFLAKSPALGMSCLSFLAFFCCFFSFFPIFFSSCPFWLCLSGGAARQSGWLALSHAAAYPPSPYRLAFLGQVESVLLRETCQCILF